MAAPQGKESRAAGAAGSSARDEAEEAGPLNAIPELMRRAFTLGLSGFFVTEEAFRRALGTTLPKDWLDFVVEQSSRTRSEFVERLGAEVGRTLENADLAAVLAQLLEGRTVEVKAEIRLTPKSDGAGAAASGKGRRRAAARERDEAGRG